MEPDRRLRGYPIASHRRNVRDEKSEEEFAAMKTIATLFTIAALTLAANAADAKGCIKGAVVGGVAGHYAGHHGVIGAIAGCAYGRHHAKEQARQQQDQQPGRAPAGQDNKL
jgi:outer membrane lipoprotein SlyB